MLAACCYAGCPIVTLECCSARPYSTHTALPGLCAPHRLVERFLLDNYKPHQLSTYALTLYRYNFKTQDGKAVPVGEQQLWFCPTPP